MTAEVVYIKDNFKKEYILRTIDANRLASGELVWKITNENMKGPVKE